jgi:transposase InsO family protein
MKSSYPQTGLVRLCWLLGVTRQAYYQHFWHKQEVSIEQELVLKAVYEIRSQHRSMGCRKLLGQLQPMLLEHQIKMGRDALFDLLASHNLLVRRKRRRVYTTNSFHWLRKYPNLIQGFEPDEPNQLWVSDITYFKIREQFSYISFITDAYSRKIVGYHIANSLEGIETLQALKMAISAQRPDSDTLIHHSDRGVQYCSEAYVKLLQDNKIAISMTETGDPLDNAIAERINGIIKQEYLEHCSIKSLKDARKMLDQAVKLYNEQRPHLSLGMSTPDMVHYQGWLPQRLWKLPNYKNVTPIQD